LDGDAVLRRSLCDHSLPLYGAGARDARSVFLYGHLQSKEDGGFILVEHGDDAPTVDDGNQPVQRVGNIAGLAVNLPDACRSYLMSERLLFLLGCKPQLREVGPICAAVRIGRWANVQPVYFLPCIEPPLIALICITPSSKLCGCSRISVGGPVRYP
jgi:hypothetical protein